MPNTHKEKVLSGSINSGYNIIIICYYQFILVDLDAVL
jgi:hypothetical protein